MVISHKDELLAELCNCCGELIFLTETLRCDHCGEYSQEVCNG